MSPLWIPSYVYLFFGKVPSYTVFYAINIKNPTYMPLVRPTCLLIAEKTSYLHDYQGPLLGLLGTPGYSRKTHMSIEYDKKIEGVMCMHVHEKSVATHTLHLL